MQIVGVLKKYHNTATISELKLNGDDDDVGKVTTVKFYKSKRRLKGTNREAGSRNRGM